VDLELSDEHEAFRKVVREFALMEVAPHAAEWDRTASFPIDAVRSMGALGWFGLPFPARYGGSESDFLIVCLAIEELARVDSSIAITLSAAIGLGANPIHRFGSPEQRERWLPDLCAGRALGAFALTEPGAGSDAAAITTRARADGDAWVIDGRKEFITNSGTPLTAFVTVAARTGPDEISAFVVPSGTPGLEVEPAYRKLGWRASDTHPIRLDECRVGAGDLLGDRGQGLHEFLGVLEDGRIAIAALGVGLAQGCLDEALAYATQRRAFGGPIGRYEAIAFECADLAVAIEGARLLMYRAATLKDRGRPFGAAASMAKLAASEAAVRAAREAVQVFGGYGYVDDAPVARFYRDAKILEIGEGTSEIQRLLIARGLGLPIEP
jgi:butyryl-CoA dehydrogenase